MNTTITKTFLAPLVFVIAQLLGGIILFPLAINGGNVPIAATAAVLIVTGICATAFCWKVLGLIEPGTVLSCRNINGRVVAYGIWTAICGIVAMDILSELADLPDMIEDTVINMGHNIVGIMALAVVGPIVEELIFREAMMGYMMRSGKVNTWVAVCISALAFGLIHLNPAQVPFAFVMGLLLGLLYYKTGSIVLCGTVHILNKSMAVLEVNILGEKVRHFSLVDSLGGTPCAVAVATVASILCLISARYLILSRSNKD